MTKKIIGGIFIAPFDLLKIFFNIIFVKSPFFLKPRNIFRFLILFPFLLNAQVVDIRGIVADSSSGERIPSANVLIVSLAKGTVTNTAGFYLIPTIPPGKYKITASSIGYKKQTQQIVVTTGQPLIVNFGLVQEVVELEEVVVTEKSKRELTEINTSVHVLDQREMKMAPVTVQEDVFRSIQILPGIVSTSEVSSQFYVRGGAGDQNLILLDGIKIYNPYHAMSVFSVFDTDILNTTEVYTGAFPPGYGGRLSSVVNLITKDGKSTAMSGRSNINFLSSKVQLEGPLGEHIRVLANGRKSLFTNVLKNFFNQDTPISFYDALAKVTLEGSESQSKYSLLGFFSGDDLKSSKLDDPDYFWKTQAIGVTASGLLQDRVFVSVVAFGSSFSARRDAKTSSIITPASTSVKEFSIRANATIYTDSHDLYFIGFEFSFPTLEYTFVNNTGTERRIANTLPEISTWFRMQSKVGDFNIDGGVHLEAGSLFQGNEILYAFQPRLNLSYGLNENWKIKFSYGRFTQNIITVNNEDDLISLFDAWIAIPEGLTAEHSDHYVAGVDGVFFQGFSAGVQFYYKDFGSLVSYNRDKVDARDPDYVNSKGSSYGVEFLARFFSPILDIYSTYTLSWVFIAANNTTYYPRYDRRHTAKFLATLHPISNFDITLQWDLGSGFPYTQAIGYYDRRTLGDLFSNQFIYETGVPYTRLGDKNAARLPTYHRLDASVSYRFKIEPLRATIGLHIINVYDRKNLFYFDRKTGQRVNMLPFFPSATLNVEF